LFSIYAEQGDLTADLRVPSMLGTYRVEADSLQFRPRFALEPGFVSGGIFRNVSDEIMHRREAIGCTVHSEKSARYEPPAQVQTAA